MKKIILIIVLTLSALHLFSQIAVNNDISICEVSRIDNIYVFTDCEPLGEYEVIGEVSLTGYENFDFLSMSGEYQTLRDELIRKAKLANTKVEGVLLELVTGGTDKAHLISFEKSYKNFPLARANRYSGIYVFCDSKPLSKYEYLGNIKGKATLVPQYTHLRDSFIKKCAKKYKQANGIIIHLTAGGYDSAEAISL